MHAFTIVYRICGGAYQLSAWKSHAPCPACKAEDGRPRVTGESLQQLQRATRLRLAGDMEAACRCYEAVLSANRNEHEALWGRLMCKYGVTFSAGLEKGVRRTAVHVPRDRSMRQHADLLRACKLAPKKVRTQYEVEADWVDEALMEICMDVDATRPCEVFICHDAAADDPRSEALDRALTVAGYRVFRDAPRTERQPGANHAAETFHALATADVMLLVAPDAANPGRPQVRSA